jgi:hypothetical protein
MMTKPEKKGLINGNKPGNKDTCQRRNRNWDCINRWRKMKKVKLTKRHRFISSRNIKKHRLGIKDFWSPKNKNMFNFSPPFHNLHPI